MPCESPYVFVKASEFFLYFKKPFGVFNRAKNLQLVSYDSRVIHQSFEILLCIFRYFPRIETVKCFSEIFSFFEDSSPAQSGLKSVQKQIFEQSPVIVERNSPF